MRSMKVVCAAALILSCAAVQAADSFSLGVILGHPTGISAKLWLGPTSAVDAALAWNFQADQLHFHADYLHHFFDVFDVAPDRLPLYVGIGADLRLRADGPGASGGLRSGVRVPLGISFLSAEVPLDLFAEVVPAMRLYPATTFDIWWGIGARYRF